MLDDTLYTIACAQVRDRYAEAARRAFLDAACRCGCARAGALVAVGMGIVRIGERIAGIRVVPAGPFNPVRTYRA